MVRFFVQRQDTPDSSAPPETTGGVIILNAEDSAHIRSLRMRPSEQFIVCDGNGSDYICRLAEKSSPQGASAEIISMRPTSGEPAVACIVYIAFAKGDRLDYAVQKSVELGARGIVLFRSERCVTAPGDAGKKTARMQRIALEAAKQCGRGYIPDVTAAHSFREAVENASGSGLPLFFYEREEELNLKNALDSRASLSSVSIVTGPEGGFEESEAELARSLGMLTVTLGPRVLRCETAPVAALAAIMYHTGNM